MCIFRVAGSMNCTFSSQGGGKVLPTSSPGSLFHLFVRGSAPAPPVAQPRPSATNPDHPPYSSTPATGNLLGERGLPGPRVDRQLAGHPLGELRGDGQAQAGSMHLVRV